MPSTIATDLNAFWPASYAMSQSGVLYITNGLQRPKRWDGLASEVQAAGVLPPSTAPSISVNAAAGGATAGKYTFAYRFVTEDGRPSNLSPVATVDANDNDGFSWSGLETPVDAHATVVELYRSTSGQSSTLYLVASLPAGTGGHAGDNAGDADLALNDALKVLNANGTPNANRFGVPPAKACIASFYDRMFYAGDVVYDLGHVSLSNGSGTVVGHGTDWQAGLVGRRFYSPGSSTEYEVTDVASADSMTISPAWDGATTEFAEYAVRAPATERQKVYYSRALEPESVPALENVRIQEDGDDITGLMPLRNYLFVLESRHIYRLSMGSQPSRQSTDPFPGVIVQHALSRGALNNRCWVRVEDNAYLCDAEGVYLFDGNEFEVVSGAIQDYFRDQPLNWGATKFWFMSLDRRRELVRLHVSLGSETFPRSCLTYHYRTRTWWVERFPEGFGGWCETLLAGDTPAVLFAGESGRFFTLDGTLDCVQGRPARMRLSGGSVATVTIDSGEGPLPPWDGSFPISIVAGRGHGQSRMAVQQSGRTYVVDRPWRVVPDATSVVQLGGVPWYAETASHRHPEEEGAMQRRALLVAEPTTHAGTIDLQFLYDRSQQPAEMVERTDLGGPVRVSESRKHYAINIQRQQGGHEFSGFAQVRDDGFVPTRGMGRRFVRLRISGVQGAERVVIYEVLYEGAS